MDQGIKNTCLVYQDLIKAIDMAVWLNFKHRKLGYTPFSVIEGPDDDDCAVVSYDVRDLFEQPSMHPLFGDYVDYDFEFISRIYRDTDPLVHWENLKGAFSGMDGELLRFILQMKIPLEKFIRYELASRGFNENHEWCGFEKAKEIWLKE